MVGRAWWWALVLLTPAPAGLAAQQAPAAQESPAAPGRVHAVLFYSPTCPHCQEVMTEGLPPILDRYGDRLQVVVVDAASAVGGQLYGATVQRLSIPRERTGVPTLVVGSRVLVGAFEIPTYLPEIVERGLAAGGIDWPEVPLVRQALAAQGLIAGAEPSAGEDTATGSAAEPGPEADADRGAAPDAIPAEEPEDRAPAPTPPVARASEGSLDPPGTEEAGSSVPPGAGAALPDPGIPDSVLAGAIRPDTRSALVHQLSVADRVMLDPAGNGAAIAVLILMFATVALVAGDVAGRIRIPAAPTWVVPALCLAGMGVASYLAFVEVTGSEAVCGPVGDCNTVQQSRYASLLGVPIGLLGVAGYAALLAAWLAARAGPEPAARLAHRAVWWLALVATAFSIYLTFLEPFVIGASCAWCLTSALVSTGILAAATPARRGVREEAPGPAAPTASPA